MSPPEAALFTIKAADDVEQDVLKTARAKLNASLLPEFNPAKNGLGFQKRVLDRFCADAPLNTLQMALRASSQELDAMRAAGVKNMAELDKVRLKMQLLRAMIAQRSSGGSAAEASAADVEGDAQTEEGDAAAAAAAAAASAAQQQRDSIAERVRRGEITPLEAAAAAAGRGARGSASAGGGKREGGRTSMMQYKLGSDKFTLLPKDSKKRSHKKVAIKTESAAASPYAGTRIRGMKTPTPSRKRPRQESAAPARTSPSPPSFTPADDRRAATTSAETTASSGDSSAQVSPAAAAAAAADTASADASAQQKWACPRCTLLNASDNARCVACNGRRPAATRRAAAARRNAGADASDGVIDVSSAEDAAPQDRRRQRQTRGAPATAAANGELSPMHSDSAGAGAAMAAEEEAAAPPRRRRLRRAAAAARRSDSDAMEGSDSDAVIALDDDSDDTGEAASSGCEGASARGGGGSGGRARKVRAARGRGRAVIGLVDDFHDDDYEERLEVLADEQAEEEEAAEDAPGGEAGGAEGGGRGEDVVLDGGLTVAARVASRLFQFQVTGIRWMWQLHQQGAGGIVGDEMGLGKTVQIAAYLGALHASGKLRSAIVVAPATVLAHWVRELHVWAPRLRVVLLHRSGAAYNAAWGAADGVDTVARRALRLAPAVVALTSYEGLRTLQRRLLSHDWDVAVLDEAQRIRNPDADITLVCKQLRTSARLALTGTPIQNSLLELWSLFDFVFPGRLGTLPAFDSEFATPIRVGGYANASPAQAQLAYRCAVVLRGLIDPHLLRRQKHDVRDAVKLPHKTEQVLFCRLTRRQRALYMDAICSPQVQAILGDDGRNASTLRGQRFRAIGVLRKLCNHADLACPPGASIAAAMAGTDPLEAAESDSDSELVGEEAEFGAAERSGKLLVLQQLLPLWRAAGHRVLVFTQTRGMLGILERWVRSRGWVYGRLDGNTPVGARQGLIDRFNTDPEVFIMLLTTRTGGVGTNLTGADRVLLFDPDWNPSTDAQARERAWRVGQTKPVTVYRLITAGTIEEKIYHRQIFKTALTNRVLKDPRQRRLFNRSDLHELFLLGDDGSADGLTETNDVFQGAGVVELKKRPSRRNGASGGSGARGNGAGGSGGGSRGTRGGGGGSVGASGGGGSARLPAGGAAAAAAAAAADGGAAAGGAPPLDADEEAASMLVAEVSVNLAAAEEGGEGGGGSNGGGGESTGRAEDPGDAPDAGVLRALFDKAPLSGVFVHDLAEGGSAASAARQARRAQIERQAEAAAIAALERLRESRRAIHADLREAGSAGDFVPTWTGRSGAGGRRFGGSSGDGGGGGGSAGGMSSQALLQCIQQRHTQRPPSPTLFAEATAPAAAAAAAAAGGGGGGELNEQLLRRLQQFFRERRNVRTDDILAEFADVQDQHAVVFKQLLRAVAVCRQGVWSWKEDADF